MKICWPRQHKFIAFLLLLFAHCAPREESADFSLKERTKDGLIQAEQQALKLPLDEQMQFWQKQADKKLYQQIPEAQARIYYRLAGAYYNRGDLDSIKFYMRNAWDVLEGHHADAEILVLLNYGEGNISTIEGNIHQENYFFNLASQGIVSDSLVALSAVQKATIFMATAQSDARLNQFSQAMDWNRRAIQTLQGEEVPARLLYRAYRQLANNFRVSSGGNLDSTYHYIQLIDSIWRNNKEQVNPRFLYDEKAHYFQRLQQPDSAIVYHQKILSIDQQILKEQPQHPPSHTNLFKDFINLSQNYLQLANVRQATHFMERAQLFIRQNQKFLTDADHQLYQEALVNYYFITKQYDKAFAEYNVLQEKIKALYENKYTQSIAEMATIYKLRANEKHITNLNQQVLQTENKLAQNRLWLIISGLSALLAIALGVILYIGRKQTHLKEEKEKVQLQKRAMELQQQLLRTQMEPHFIFNTLAALQSYIRIEEKEKALRYLNQFSRLLRNSLELSRESQVPLKEEIATLQYYLALQQMRYEDRFDYEVQKYYDEEMNDQCLIPPMLIQPFVENAILHGVANAKERGMIAIHLTLDENALSVKIIDDGPGINALKQKPDGKKKSLSTTISRERLEILAKEKGVEIHIRIMDRSEIDKNLTGTQVELVIPIESDF